MYIYVKDEHIASFVFCVVCQYTSVSCSCQPDMIIATICMGHAYGGIE
jgi:hypothetical protein